MEMDCTKAGKGKTDRTIRAGLTDDNTAIVTKSDKCGSAVCGRLGDGRSLPVFIVFNSSDSFEPAWAPHYVSEDIYDNEVNPLPWRYISNPKGSVNEDFCCDYVKEISHPALGYPKPEKHTLVSKASLFATAWARTSATT